MRRRFVELLYNEMKYNEDIYVITADLGYGMFDKIRDNYPDRFFNCGSAEQLMLGIGIGLAEEGKIPICYSITPFILYRPFELIRTYINHEVIPVKLVGSGRNKDYLHDEFTHWAMDDYDFIDKFRHIYKWSPNNIEELEKHFNYFIYGAMPYYLNLKR